MSFHHRCQILAIVGPLELAIFFVILDFSSTTQAIQAVLSAPPAIISLSYLHQTVKTLALQRHCFGRFRKTHLTGLHPSSHRPGKLRNTLRSSSPRRPTSNVHRRTVGISPRLARMTLSLHQETFHRKDREFQCCDFLRRPRTTSRCRETARTQGTAVFCLCPGAGSYQR